VSPKFFPKRFLVVEFRNNLKSTKLNMKKNQFILATLAMVSLATAAQAQNYLNTFDDSSSFVTSSGFPTFGSYGLDNPGTPTVPNVRFDFGTVTSDSIAWASGPTQDAGSNPSSGSLQLNWTWATPPSGGQSAAFTIDLLNTAQSYSSISFDIMVAAGSTPDAFGGYGDFSVATRDSGYAFNGTGFEQELANSGFSSPASPGAGVWQHVTINLSGADSSIRAITLQDFDSADRNISGPETIDIDNLTLTPAPEPSTIALAGLGLAGLFGFRRFRKS
jgi:hypothetical protein